MHKVRRWVFANYWWIIIATLVTSVYLILRIPPTYRASLFVSCVGTALAFCFFVLQQKLSEDRMFKDLFTEYNSRYDELNGILTDISQSESTPTPEMEKAIQDYFNLCAEEYYFYKQGYIPEKVWTCWHNGMMIYFKVEIVKSLWNEEAKQNANDSDSYYGFSKIANEMVSKAKCQST